MALITGLPAGTLFTFCVKPQFLFIHQLMMKLRVKTNTISIKPGVTLRPHVYGIKITFPRQCWGLTIQLGQYFIIYFKQIWPLTLTMPIRTHGCTNKRTDACTNSQTLIKKVTAISSWPQAGFIFLKQIIISSCIANSLRKAFYTYRTITTMTVTVASTRTDPPTAMTMIICWRFIRGTVKWCLVIWIFY